MASIFHWDAVEWCFSFQSEFRKQKEHLIPKRNGKTVGARNHPLLAFIRLYPYSLFLFLGPATPRTEATGGLSD